jgi:chemotaxis protein MotB
MKSKNLARIEEKTGNTAGWLTTFNDLITLLMVFFVLLFTMGSMDKDLMKDVQNALQSGLGALSAGSKVSVALNGSQRLTPLGDPLTQAQGGTTPGGEDSSADSLDEALDELNAEPGISVKYENEEIRISFEDALLFDLGKAAINSSGLALLDNMAALIQANSCAVRVEGHTDNIPIHTQRFPSNWDLSTARAISVVKYFIHIGKINPKRLSAVGYGETRPLAPNDSPAKRARNRRVEIVLEMEDEE